MMQFLVIDDNEADLLLARRVLAQHGFAEVEVCDSPKQALARACLEPKIDLILLDLLMPEIDGLEVCRLLKSEPRSSGIPVIMITQCADPKDMALAFAAGAEDYVRKPIGDSELPARVRRVLDSSASRERLAEQERALRRLTSDLEIGLLTWIDGKVVFANPAAVSYVGQPLAGRDASQLPPHTESTGDCDAPPLLWDLLRDGALGAIPEVRIDRSSGGSLPVSAVLSPLQHSGSRIGTAVAFQDDRARFEREQLSRLAAEALEATALGIVVTDLNGVIQKVNSSFTEITGYSESEVVGRNASILQSGSHSGPFYSDMWRCLLDEGTWEGEIWNRHRAGHAYSERLSIRATHDSRGRVSNYVGTFSNNSERKGVEDRLRRLAFYDSLTGLPNRFLFNDRLGKLLERSRRNDSFFALAYVDLDHFKAINDAEGHSEGDRVLRELASRLRSLVRSSDTVARIGGDEFVIILEDLEEASQADRIAAKLLAGLAAKPAIRASIGLAIGPSETEDAEGLLRAADQAMFVAKRAGGCRISRAPRVAPEES